ncbi:uncharacterized protein A1O5_06825 [Cladophialophora psammophila CBS 110553]|uniref:3-oxoacyl-[acyl-carrier protein] reductase n=1 Tax=Cladophialophora psammophila CBS 110553 TaxID=1182543 RepID=W9XHB4_9EURO|nr:uncharacterized protein A1O5_06825 [Cladophialophora psammophila CBS 110553]EXJ69754.1 hypothetical protein A1O5_06825 [Cladophialophora psammophila CBS 110553]
MSIGENQATSPNVHSGSRVVIVTGGADGFGAAIVDRFSKEGCKVIFIDLNRDKGEKKVEKNAGLHFICGDVTCRETWEEALRCGRESFGRVDIVVNNAGITYSPSPVHTKPIEQYDKIFNINLKPVFLSAQVICPFMLEQGSGAFINITSTGCTRPRPGFAFYNASKAAVNIASKTMALEYAPTIRFNCICPAVGNTSMLQASIGDGTEAQAKLRQLEEMLPMRRVTEPEDIANAAWFLGSDQSSFITGTTIEVDGGRGV